MLFSVDSDQISGSLMMYVPAAIGCYESIDIWMKCVFLNETGIINYFNYFKENVFWRGGGGGGGGGGK